MSRSLRLTPFALAASLAPTVVAQPVATRTAEPRQLAVLEHVRLLPPETGPERPEEEPVVQPVRPPGYRRFFTSAGEVALFELAPWAYNRYVVDEDFARISWDTVERNFERGFGYDPDTFEINQSSHPYHGSLFFNSARENGYGFWGSSLFTLAGSLFWEYFMENTRPSTNDLVNTTLGGMTRGEVAHRVSAIILDNQASGTNRLLREIGAGIINPAAFRGLCSRRRILLVQPENDLPRRLRGPQSPGGMARLRQRHVPDLLTGHESCS